MYSSAYVWAKILSYLEERLTPVIVSNWFDDCEVVELNEENLILFSPTDFRREVIVRRCTQIIQQPQKSSPRMISHRLTVIKRRINRRVR